MTSDFDGEQGVLFVPLGGCEEIGMNLNLYGLDGKWLMVDLGINFGEENLPGIDLVMPDLEFIEERKSDLVGLVLTHAHEDHYGAVAYLWPWLECPVYATPFTAELLRGKLAEAGLLDRVPLHEVALEETITLDPFTVTFVTLTHSIPEPNALAIETSHGAILHTGDWKIDPDPLLGDTTDVDTLRRYGEKGVTAMVCDSTNVFVPGRSGSEAEVRDHLIKLIGECDYRVGLTTFASNVARIKTMIEAGAANGRQAAIVGRSLHRTVEAAISSGYFKDVPALLSAEEAAELPRDKVLYILTGSQGEPMGAMARIAREEHADVKLEAGDTVIFSSKIIPGNEKKLSALYNMLARQDIEVITEEDRFVHVSGHPCRDELADMYHWVKPNLAIPVHGEQRHLHEHARYAKKLQVPHAIVPENGAVIRITEKGGERIGDVTAGRILLDGDIMIPDDSDPIKERRRLLYNGYLSVHLVLERDDSFAAPPDIHWEGVPLERGDEKVRRRFEDAVIDAIDSVPRRKRDDESIKEAVRRAVRRLCRDLCGKKAITRVSLTRVS